MIPRNISKEHLEKAIQEIDKEGIRKGRHSSTYDLIFNNKVYPPKLVISIANKYANGEELDSNLFGGGKGTSAFRLLEKEGFIIQEKNNSDKHMYSNQLRQFLKQAKTDNLKTKHFENSFRSLKVKVSFGQGVPARIPWISFLKKPFITSDGIYPVYLYYKDIGRLILAYGISETTVPKVEWEIKFPKTVKKYFKERGFEKPARYGKSFVFKVYDINNLPNDEALDDDLLRILSEYEKVTIDNMQKKNMETLKRAELDFQQILSDFKNQDLSLKNH